MLLTGKNRKASIAADALACGWDPVRLGLYFGKGDKRNDA